MIPFKTNDYLFCIYEDKSNGVCIFLVHQDDFDEEKETYWSDTYPSELERLMMDTFPRCDVIVEGGWLLNPNPGDPIPSIAETKQKMLDLGFEYSVSMAVMVKKDWNDWE